MAWDGKEKKKGSNNEFGPQPAEQPRNTRSVAGQAGQANHVPRARLFVDFDLFYLIQFLRSRASREWR